MAERKEPLLTDNALETIRVMAVAGANINRIRAALRSTEGIWFKNDTIIAAARMFGLTVLAPLHGPPKTETSTAALERMLLKSLAPKREPDKVKIVPRGSFPVGPKGYRIGMGSQ